MRPLSLMTVWLVLVAGCGAGMFSGAPSLAELRRRVASMPEDRSAARELAIAELLRSGGDPSRAGAALSRALELNPSSLELLYLSAAEREAHGDLVAAMDGYLRVLEVATTSTDPRAATFAELSASELESLDDSVPNFAARVQGVLAPIHASPGNVGGAARSTIADLLIDIAFRQGRVDRAGQIAAEQRCLTEWRVAGPFGPRHLLGFDTELPPDTDDALADSYDLGPGRGERATRNLHARGCSLHVGGGPVAGPGTTVVESTLTLPSAGRWMLRLETPNAVQLFVDGERVARVDRRREALGRVTYHAMQLAAGDHRLRLRLSSRHPNPVVQLSASLGDEAGSVDDPQGDGLVDAFLRVQRAMARGDVVRAREAARPHLERGGSPIFLIAGAAIALTDPLRSSTVRHDTARRLLGWAEERDEEAWYPLLALAQLEANENRPLAAIEILERAAERWPSMVIFPLQLVDLLEARGWQARAEEAIARARAAVPDGCRPRRAMMTHARRRHRAQEALEHARALVACDARSDALLQLSVRRRDWELASSELTRLASLEPSESSIGELRARTDIARGSGDVEGLRAGLSALVERIPLSDELALAEGDRLLALGDAQAARRHFGAALRTEPNAMAPLWRTHLAIGGADPFASYRVEGADIIRSFEDGGQTYEQPMVLVFDYTVYRVFEDGSSLELTHNIFRLDTQEAVDSMGEFSVPEGAQMLTLRTVKADGRRLEPDEIAGKDTISFASLEPGDYIEFEYVRPRPPPAGYPGGFVGERFYFRNYETPFHLSRLTVLVPDGVELTLDPRGAAPETEIEERDGLRVYRWSVTDSRPFEREPASVAAREFFPSIYWGRGATWEMYIETLRDVLADRDPVDPAVQTLVREIVGDERATVDQHAERLHRWVLENIEDSNDVFGLAPAMVAARTGNRSRVLRYLLQTAGIDAQLALARSFAADATEGRLPDDDTYQNFVIRYRGEDGWRWTHCGARGAPFGYLPPPLEGMDALMLDASAERVTVATRDEGSHRRSVEVDLELRADGDALVRVRETFRGAGAVMWRNQLDEIPEARVESRFESAYVARLLPGAELTRLVISGREDPSMPLVLRYEAVVRNLARSASGSLVVPPLYVAQLGPQFAPVAQRSVTQLVASGMDLDVVLRLSHPEGMRVEALPRPVELTSVHGASARVAVERDGDRVLLRRSYRVPRMRISPEDYGGFARFCRAVDEAEGAEIRLAR